MTRRPGRPGQRDHPGYGPRWDAAIEYGIDVTLLEHNLRLTVTQRLQQHENMLATYCALRPRDDGRR